MSGAARGVALMVAAGAAVYLAVSGAAYWDGFFRYWGGDLQITGGGFALEISPGR